MNINLSKLAPKKKKALKLGLNAPASSSSLNAFGRGDDDDENSSPESDDDNDKLTGRDAVNRSIAKEQAALRARAEAASLKLDRDGLNGDASIYDYDGAYDSFHKSDHPKDTKNGDNGDASKKSRYIGDLLQAADRRKHERDIVYERKIARDQAVEEELEPEFRGKEKFVTAAYKRKLEERKVWQAQDDEQQKKEEANDVTKRNDGLGMASFYGNLNKNVAMGGLQETGVSDDTKGNDGQGDRHSINRHDAKEASNDLDVEDMNRKSDRRRETSEKSEIDAKTAPEIEDPEDRRKRMRLEREAKVQAARVRYFERQKKQSTRF